jgi:hypothetical protein
MKPFFSFGIFNLSTSCNYNSQHIPQGYFRVHPAGLIAPKFMPGKDKNLLYLSGFKINFQYIVHQYLR